MTQDFLQKMQQRYEELTGIPADEASDIGVRLRILAEQLELLYQQLEEEKKQAFAQTATGLALEQHAQQKGLQRRKAIAAQGEVIFSRTAAADEPIVIPQGVFLTVPSGSIRYVTVQPVTLQAGQTQVKSVVRCQTAGKSGNVAAGSLTVMVTPVQGIAAVYNEQAILSGEDAEGDEALRQRLLDSFRQVSNGTNQAFYYDRAILSGEDAEGDEALRQRLLDSFRQVSNGTNQAFYYDRAMSYPGVRCAKVVPRVNGVNTVGILLHGAGVNEALIAQMQEEIGQLKEINVDLSIEKAKEKPQQIEVEIAVEDGYSFEDISALCQQAVGRMMERQKIGQGLFPALVCREIFTCEGVENCRVKLPAQDLYPLSGEIFTLSDCTICRMARQ